MRIPGLQLEDDAALPWRATKVRGVSWIPLHLDEAPLPEGATPAVAGTAARPGATVLIRMEPGCGYTPHRHVGTEDVLVLRGGYQDEFGTWRQGDHVHYAAGSVHAPRALGVEGRPVGPDNPACILYSTVPAGIELLDPTRLS